MFIWLCKAFPIELIKQRFIITYRISPCIESYQEQIIQASENILKIENLDREIFILVTFASQHQVICEHESVIQRHFVSPLICYRGLSSLFCTLYRNSCQNITICPFFRILCCIYYQIVFRVSASVSSTLRTKYSSITAFSKINHRLFIQPFQTVSFYPCNASLALSH